MTVTCVADFTFYRRNERYRIPYLIFSILQIRKAALRGLDYILSVDNKINAELKRKALERRMKENQTTSGNEILDFINKYASEVGVDAIDPSEEGASGKGTLEDEDGVTNLNKEKLTLPKIKL